MQETIHENVPIIKGREQIFSRNQIFSRKFAQKQVISVKQNFCANLQNSHVGNIPVQELSHLFHTLLTSFLPFCNKTQKNSTFVYFCKSVRQNVLEIFCHFLYIFASSCHENNKLIRAKIFQQCIFFYLILFCAPPI
jgi:hypothetical protein